MADDEPKKAKNEKYTVKGFLKAIEGSGGVITKVAFAMGCSWNTAAKYIARSPTLQKAIEDEKSIVTDHAKNNLITAIVKKGDLQLSKWWVTMMDPDFMPKSRQEITGQDGEPIEVQHTESELTNEERIRRILAIIRQADPDDAG